MKYAWKTHKSYQKIQSINILKKDNVSGQSGMYLETTKLVYIQNSMKSATLIKDKSI